MQTKPHENPSPGNGANGEILPGALGNLPRPKGRGGNGHARGAYDVPMACPDYMKTEEATNIAWAKEKRTFPRPAPIPPELRRGNALRHGLFARDLVFSKPGDVFTMRRLRRELRREFAPATLWEETLVEQMATALWRMKQSLRSEKESGEPLSPRAQSAVGALDRQLHRAGRALEKAKTLRLGNFYTQVRDNVRALEWKVEKMEKREKERAGR